MKFLKAVVYVVAALFSFAALSESTDAILGGFSMQSFVASVYLSFSYFQAGGYMFIQSALRDFMFHRIVVLAS